MAVETLKTGDTVAAHGTVLLPSSFRDVAGFMFRKEGVLYRQINACYRETYGLLESSGLLEALTGSGRLIPHREVPLTSADTSVGWKVIQPEELGFISYPYEWCFSQLKEAALFTIDLQLTAMEHGMSLKDASAYNIQFHKGRPILIDSLSFEAYPQGQPWVAYRQFCRHFLAPLALMAKTDIQLNKLLMLHIDGIPLALASKLLPRRTWANFGLLFHVHLHAKSEQKYSQTTIGGQVAATAKVSKNGLIGILNSLRNSIDKLRWQPQGTEWGAYYAETNYTNRAFSQKEMIVQEYLAQITPASVWDLGANTGVFSRLAAARQIPTVSYDLDPAAVEMNYLRVKQEREEYLLPLVLDLTNPTPAIGWCTQERDSFMQRGPADCVLALALIHHLAISNNVPLESIAFFLQLLCKSLVIEFIPKEDSQVQRLLRSRVDIFTHYHRQGFEEAFSHFFEIQQARNMDDSSRVLYLMTKRESTTKEGV